MRKYRKIILILSFVGLITILCNQSLIVQGQTEQQASTAIQEADDKLTYALELLEAIPRYDGDIRSIILQIDIARQLIKEAKDYFTNSSFTVSYQKAITATSELDSIIEEIETKTHDQNQNKIIVLSIVGVLSGFAAILFSIFFISKIYPWYEKKKIDEYSKLEIKYDDLSGDVK